MCQQHIRTHSCGHPEALKPAFCPLSMINGGMPCTPMDVVERSSPNLCAACQAEKAAASPDAMDTSAG
jgi:hypothetical protein